ncbi:hypothetical protein ACI096_003889, partial [Cronobacter dublinensis]
KKELSLLGKEGFLSISVYKVNEIKFSPVIDESKVVKYIGIEKKIKGAHSKIEYPDGSVISDGTVFPDFDKIDKMNIKK